MMAIGMLMIFLADITPSLPWIGGNLIFLGLLSYLAQDAHKSLKGRINTLEEKREADRIAVEQKIEAERLRSEKEMRSIDGRINELHINILNKLDEVKYKLNEFRK